MAQRPDGQFCGHDDLAGAARAHQQPGRAANARASVRAIGTVIGVEGIIGVGAAARAIGLDRKAIRVQHATARLQYRRASSARPGQAGHFIAGIRRDRFAADAACSKFQIGDVGGAAGHQELDRSALPAASLKRRDAVTA